MTAEQFRLKRILLDHADTVVIALIPLLYLVINPSFGRNQPGDIDTWFYFGLAKQFWHQQGPDFYNDYYETRLPYIIPAAIIFTMPNDRIAALALSYLVYCACVFSLFYVLQRHVSKPTALLATVLMASDIFFMRTVGWQYVDSGVLAYGSLTFAALTAASSSRHRYAFVALSGFLYVSMVILHLGSAPLGLALFGYAILILDVRATSWKELFTLLFWAAIGGMVCQIIYGLLNIYLYRTEFFFEWQQVIAAMRYGAAVAPEPLHLLFATGWWLTVHIAVWLAAGAMIVASFAKLYTPTRFQLYCVWTVVSLYSVFFILDYFHFSLFLARSGLFASFYLFFSYLLIGSILPGVNRTLPALIVGGLFLLSLSLRLKFDAELARQLPAISSWAAGLTLGVFIAAVGLMQKNRLGLTLVTVAVAGVSLPITWPFFDDGEIYEAREAIAKEVGETLPYFAFSEADPVYVDVIIGLVGSFSPRASMMKCNQFPYCQQRLLGQHTMIVASGNSDAGQLASILSLARPEAKPSDLNRIYRSKDFSIYSFDMSKSPLRILGSQLPSLVGSVEDSARVATEGTSPGFLAFGPYAVLDPGRYEVTIKYKSVGATGTWDIVSVSGSNVLAKGNIPDSSGASGDIVVHIDLPNGVEDLEARTFYSGYGRLSVLSVEIRPLIPSPAIK